MITDAELRKRFGPSFVSAKDAKDPEFLKCFDRRALVEILVTGLSAGQSNGIHEQVCFSRIQTTDKDSGTMQSADREFLSADQRTADAREGAFMKGTTNEGNKAQSAIG